MIRMISFLMGLLALWASSLAPVSAQEVLYEKPDQMVFWPSATIKQASWLAGNWQGSSEDGVEVVESWVGPSGTMMAGVTLQTAQANGKDKEPQWSEHMAILFNGYTLALHYGTVSADFTDGSFEQHRLLRIEDDGCKLFFHAITYVCKRADDTGEVIGMTVYWKEPKEEWNPQPELFIYRYTRAK